MKQSKNTNRDTVCELFTQTYQLNAAGVWQMREFVLVRVSPYGIQSPLANLVYLACMGAKAISS